jgi:MFS family permease
MILFRSLRHRRFSLLLFGQTLSRMGDFVFQLALAWWVLEKTGSAAAMGAVLIFALVPSVLFALAGGVAGDRFPRVSILLISDFSRGIIMTVIALLASSGRLELWMVFGLNLLFSLADAFFQPAFLAIVPEITPNEDLTSANSLSSLSMQFARVAGPSIGGLLVAFGGTGLAFGFDAVSFFISGLLLLPLWHAISWNATPIPAQDSALKANEAFTFVSVIRNVRPAWELVRGQPILWVSILIFGLSNVLLGGPFSIGLPFLVKNVMGGDERTLGLILAAFPVGYALSSAFFGNLNRFRHRGLMIFLGLLFGGLGLGLFGLHLPLWVLLVAGLVNGAALEAGNMAWTNTLQNIVPLDKLGRVASIDMLGSLVLMPVGFALTGLAVGRWGPAPIFISFCGVCVILSLLPLLWKPIRAFD